MFHRVLLTCAVLSSTTLAARPSTIPAIREWTDGAGSWTFTSATRVVAGTDWSLATTAALFARELSALSGWTIPVVQSGAGAGDITLTVDSSDTALGQEGYRLEITDRVAIRGRPSGVLNGTRTVLQLLRTGYTAAGGTARDWPAYPERSLMVDVGRKYFTMGWLRSMIAQLSYVKLNVLHLHLLEYNNFRLQSARHPEINQTPDMFSRAQIDSLQDLAAAYGVMIIPELEMPGHCCYQSHPEVTFGGCGLDLSKDTTYRFVADILDEFIPWFRGPYWHGGCDEYGSINAPGMLEYAQAHYGPTAIARDTYLGFINYVDSVVKSNGKTLRIWSDGAWGGSAVTVNSDVVYEVWNCCELLADTAISQGHHVFNSGAQIYYILGGSRPAGSSLYNFPVLNGFCYGVPSSRASWVLGAQFCIWCDDPNAETEAQIADNTHDLLRAFSQACWGSPKLTTDYAQFSTVISALGDPPGIPEVPTVAVVSGPRAEGLAARLPAAPAVPVVYDLRGARLGPRTRMAWGLRVVETRRRGTGSATVAVTGEPW